MRDFSDAYAYTSSTERPRRSTGQYAQTPVPVTSSKRRISSTGKVLSQLQPLGCLADATRNARSQPVCNVHAGKWQSLAQKAGKATTGDTACCAVHVHLCSCPRISNCALSHRKPPAAINQHCPPPFICGQAACLWPSPVLTCLTASHSNSFIALCLLEAPTAALHVYAGQGEQADSKHSLCQLQIGSGQPSL